LPAGALRERMNIGPTFLIVDSLTLGFFAVSGTGKGVAVRPGRDSGRVDGRADGGGAAA